MVPKIVKRTGTLNRHLRVIKFFNGFEKKLPLMGSNTKKLCIRNFMHDDDIPQLLIEVPMPISFEYLPFTQTIFTEINLFFIEIP